MKNKLKVHNFSLFKKSNLTSKSIFFCNFAVDTKPIRFITISYATNREALENQVRELQSTIVELEESNKQLISEADESRSQCRLLVVDKEKLFQDLDLVQQKYELNCELLNAALKKDEKNLEKFLLAKTVYFKQSCSLPEITINIGYNKQTKNRLFYIGNDVD